MTQKAKNGTTQEAKVLSALLAGATVTKLTAYHQGIGNIHDVIMRLRRKGFGISTVYNRDLNDNKYCKYVLL